MRSQGEEERERGVEQGGCLPTTEAGWALHAHTNDEGKQHPQMPRAAANAMAMHDFHV